MAFYVTPVQREIKDPDEKARRLARMLEIEDEVFQTAAGICQATMDFYQVEPGQEEPPPEWVERYGAEAAKQRLRVAKTGWEPASTAPSGAKLAQSLLTGISRGRRNQLNGAGPRTINAVIALPAPTSASMPGAPEYPSKEVE